MTRVLLAGCCALLIACGDRASPPREMLRDPEAPAVDVPPPTEEPGDDRGIVWYQAMCQSCHGAAGEGIGAPALNAWSRSRETLVEIIDARMPLGAPERCDAICAERIADYILGELQSPPPTCDAIVPPPQALRLLTRREYRNTLRDLFALPAPPCMSDVDCAINASCSNAACTPDPCDVVTFQFEPGGRALRDVWVSGSMNGWAMDVARGAWPLTFDPVRRRWITKRNLANGTHAYKFVLDGNEWIADPLRVEREPDGFGGENSVLRLDCRMDAPFDPAGNLPVESRPSGYPFDNAHAAGLVSAVHVGEIMRTAEILGARMSPRFSTPDALVAFASRVYRRPLAPDESSRLRELATASGVEVALRVLLASPEFLYRSEVGIEEGGVFRLTPFEEASLLSYLLWGTMPDERLFDAAARGTIDREAEARRMLSDPRARDQLAEFAVAWLGLTDPGAAAAAETRRFVTHVIFDGSHRFDELLTAQYSFVNGELAALYGVGAPSTAWARVDLPDERRGLLTQASVLATYAHSDQSSPIKRGLFVRERLLCQKFGTPPPDAGGLPEVDPNATTRERFAMHTAKESCRACHQYIDDVGFGFERFDQHGRFRTTEGGRAIDARGNMNDVEGLGTGTQAPFADIAAFAEILANADSPELCFATQYLRFARGAFETAGDRCVAEDMVVRGRGDIREGFIALINSPTFVERRRQE